MVLHHHERWDVLGCPDGWADEAIPIGARIIAIADAYQAMTKRRSFRPGLGQSAAIAEIRRCAGPHVDPALVEPFIALLTGEDGELAMARLAPHRHGRRAALPPIGSSPGEESGMPIIGPWTRDGGRTAGSSPVAD